MKHKKLKRILICLGALVIGICLLLFYAVFVGFYSAAEKSVGEYTGTASLDFLGDKECYAVGQNRYGQPVFLDMRAAFAQAEIDFAGGIQLIYDTFHEEYHVPPFGPKTYSLYFTLGWQAPTADEELRRQASAVTRFLDIYSNSEKRWYLTPVGWSLA